MQIIFNEFGQYLGSDKQNFIVYKDKKPLKKIPFWKVKQIILTPGNTVSTSALFWCSVYGINVSLMSNTGKPLSVMEPMMSKAHIDTRMKQYEARSNVKGVEIAKAIIRAKIQNQISFLEKHGFDSRRLRIVEMISKIDGDKVDDIRPKLVAIESRCSKVYFGRLMTMFPDFLLTPKRMRRSAKDPLNNLFNLGYEVLKGEVYRAVIGAHLDPYFGYIHRVAPYQLSLVYDIQDLFRGVIDEFLIDYAQKLNPSNFEIKGDRMFLKEKQSYLMIKELDKVFEKRIKHKMMSFGEHPKIRTAIREEPLRLAQYLRGEKEEYKPLRLFYEAPFCNR